MGVGRISPPEHSWHTQVCMLLTISSASDRASLDRAGGWHGSGLQSGGKQVAEVVPVGHGRQALEHFGQPDFGGVPVACGAL
jgi:hypothetical protein